MRTLVSLLATAALVGGVTIASAQSGSPTAPSGPMAASASASNATQGVGGTQRIETTGQATTTNKGAKAAPKKPAPKGSGSPSEPSGAGAGGAPARRGAEFLLRIGKITDEGADAPSLRTPISCPRWRASTWASPQTD